MCAPCSGVAAPRAATRAAHLHRSRDISGDLRLRRRREARATAPRRRRPGPSRRRRSRRGCARLRRPASWCRLGARALLSGVEGANLARLLLPVTRPRLPGARLPRRPRAARRLRLLVRHREDANVVAHGAPRVLRRGKNAVHLFSVAWVPLDERIGLRPRCSKHRLRAGRVRTHRRQIVRSPHKRKRCENWCKSAKLPTPTFFMDSAEARWQNLPIAERAVPNCQSTEVCGRAIKGHNRSDSQPADRLRTPHAAPTSGACETEVTHPHPHTFTRYVHPRVRVAMHTPPTKAPDLTHSFHSTPKYYGPEYVPFNCAAQPSHVPHTAIPHSVTLPCAASRTRIIEPPHVPFRHPLPLSLSSLNIACSNIQEPTNCAAATPSQHRTRKSKWTLDRSVCAYTVQLTYR